MVALFPSLWTEASLHGRYRICAAGISHRRFTVCVADPAPGGHVLYTAHASAIKVSRSHLIIARDMLASMIPS